LIGVLATILARSLFDPIQVTVHIPAPDRWKAQLNTHGQSDVYVVDNKFPPGASTGWHSHPGPSLILVVTGTVTNYPGDDPGCPAAYLQRRGGLHRPRRWAPAPAAQRERR